MTALDVAVPEGEHTADLRLAAACLAGDRAALARLEAEYLRGLATQLARVNLAGPICAEAVAVLRERLLVGEAPRLAVYRGRGPLRAWLRVAALRIALDLVRKQDRERPFEPSLAEALTDEREDPELAHLKHLYRAAFAAAFDDALAALTPRERNLLRHQVAHGLGVDQIGAIYRVHRATAARWVEAARARLSAGVRARLMARLRVDVVTMESILRLIESQIDVSVRRRLGDAEE